MDRKKLAKELFDIANDEVGSVGADVNSAFYASPRKRELVFFCLHRKPPFDYTEITNTWKKWVSAYCEFKKLERPELISLIDDPDLVINWRNKPEVWVNGWPDGIIEKTPADKWDGGRRPDLLNPEFLRVRAAMVISRTDFKLPSPTGISRTQDYR